MKTNQLSFNSITQIVIISEWMINTNYPYWNQWVKVNRQKDENRINENNKRKEELVNKIIVFLIHKLMLQ